ncbi:hypothetical protein ACFE04_006125 [Oxalis oulophora]
MANEMIDQSSTSSLSFFEFPEDVQVNILSFLSPNDIFNFALTSKQFIPLSKNDTKLWFTLCHRRWGSNTHISKWVVGSITYKHLYKTLHQYDNLIGLWRRCGGTGTLSPSSSSSSQLVVSFQWGPSFLTGTWVNNNNSISSIKPAPFFFLGISSNGQVSKFVDLNGHTNQLGEFLDFSQLGVFENDLVSVNVNFIQSNYLLVEENRNRTSSLSGGEENEDCVVGSPTDTLPDQFVSDMYVQIANKTSPGADKRRHRRKEKERQGRKKWETEHFIKL